MNAVDLVPTQRETLAGYTGDIQRLEALFASWDETQRGVVDAYRRAIEELQGEAFRRLIRALKSDPTAMQAMKTAVTDEIVYAVLRHHNILKPSLSERVEAALDGVRPMLASHGGDVELVSVRPPAIEVRFTGACDGCPASALTFHAGVKKAVEEACPEITDILQVKGSGSGANDSVRFVSPFALGAVDGWHLVCRLDEIPQGGITTRVVGGENVILSRQGAVVSCFQNACAHLGLEIDGGEVEDGIVTCPWHGFRYDLATGECLTAPEVQLQTHMVKVIGNRVEVRLAR
ncbi:NifU family protein [Mesorhizobium sp. VK25A]|uniref:NifU family protein n=1 Tax=Mesorhizobium vachelliae TaxID=3072309 RepID=A0ABU5A5Z1_9HYPH|nr:MULTISPECIES: NifU family protein [unclassified Mesorhizobium]MDX8533116.1 NifU family protein [Mesorhizobium sp. VK25D]MDX8545035.1 NifU family protein [Mesorhizobium sp. VK25A]